MAEEHLDTNPYFAAEAGALFVVGRRVVAVESTVAVAAGAEGVYEGRHPRFGAIVRWQSADGYGYRETVRFRAIRPLPVQ